MPSRPLDIEVTAEHIRYGEPRNEHRCPIALAFKAADPDDIEHVSVTWLRIRWSRLSTDTRHEISTPRPAKRWLERLDEADAARRRGEAPRRRPRPFIFTVDEAAALTWPRRHRRHSGWTDLAARPPGRAYSTSYRPARSELAAMEAS